MEVLLVATVLIVGFWAWAKNETEKRHKQKRSKYDYYRPPTPIRSSKSAYQNQLTPQQQVWVWVCIVVLQVAWFYRDTLATSFVAAGNSGEGTGFGQVDTRNLANFPPPHIYQEVGGTASVVTFINGSPDALTIILTKDTGERVELKMPACRECTLYSRDNPPEYGSVGTPITFQIPPGAYKARGSFFGVHNTKGFQSDWQLTPGWEYRSSIYTLDEVQFY